MWCGSTADRCHCRRPKLTHSVTIQFRWYTTAGAEAILAAETRRGAEATLEAKARGGAEAAFKAVGPGSCNASC
jgi:hypothetical protein